MKPAKPPVLAIAVSDRQVQISGVEVGQRGRGWDVRRARLGETHRTAATVLGSGHERSNPDRRRFHAHSADLTFAGTIADARATAAAADVPGVSSGPVRLNQALHHRLD